MPQAYPDTLRRATHSNLQTHRPHCITSIIPTQPTFRFRDHRIRSRPSLSEVFEERVDLPQEQQVQDLGSLHHDLKS